MPRSKIPRRPKAAIWLTRDPVPVTVEMIGVARLASVNRGNACRTRFGAIAIIRAARASSEQSPLRRIASMAVIFAGLPVCVAAIGIEAAGVRYGGQGRQADAQSRHE